MDIIRWEVRLAKEPISDLHSFNLLLHIKQIILYEVLKKNWFNKYLVVLLFGWLGSNYILVNCVRQNLKHAN